MSDVTKKILKFRNAKSPKTNDDLVQDYVAKGGNITKGETAPMDSSLKYKKRIRAATVNSAALSGPNSVKKKKKSRITEMRLLKNHVNEKTGKGAKVYFDGEWDEYKVKHFDKGQHVKNADYHTDDRNDAHDTAKHWIKTKSQNEEVISELTKKLLNRYRIKATDQTSSRQVMMLGKTKKDRSKGIEMSDNKVVAREEVEQVDEVSPTKLRKYVDYALTAIEPTGLRRMDADANRHFEKGETDKGLAKSRKATKRAQGINTAMQKVTNSRNVKVHAKEKDITELSVSKMKDYMNKSDDTDRFDKIFKKRGAKSAEKSSDAYMNASDKIQAGAAPYKTRKEDVNNVDEGKTFRAGDDSTRDDARKKIKVFSKARKDAQLKRNIDEKNTKMPLPLKKGFHLWDTSDGKHYPEGGHHETFTSAKAALRKNDYHDSAYGIKKNDNSLAVGYHDGEHFWSVGSSGKKEARLTEDMYPEVKSLNKKKRLKKNRAKIEPTGIR